MTLPSLSVLAPIWGLAELCLAVITRSRSPVASKDRGSVVLIWAACLGGIALADYGAHHFPAWALPNRKMLYTTAYCLFIFGLFVRFYSIIYLGRFFTPTVSIASDHRLIDSGPYRFIRHPTYTGLLMIVLGFGLSFANLASLLSIFLPILLCLLWRIQIEERALTQAFGDQYRFYMRRTKRLIPLIY